MKCALVVGTTHMDGCLHWLSTLCLTGRGDVSLGDILQFFSGSTKLPAAGFNCTPKIYFTDELCLPRASTCDLSITFPRSFGSLSYEDFKAKMNMCVCDSFGFGKPWHSVWCYAYSLHTDRCSEWIHVSIPSNSFHLSMWPVGVGVNTPFSIYSILVLGGSIKYWFYTIA